jgi:general secretion pathway protein D
MPDVIRSRALPELPVALRPIFQVIDLHQVSVGDMQSWLANAYGAKVKVFPSPRTGSILLLGLPTDVRAAVEAVQILDQARLAGRESLRVTPVYWTATKLADQLVTVLKAEGYDASASYEAAAAAVMVIPIQANNSIVVFAADTGILSHVRQWVADLDQPANADPLNNIFVYSVQNTTAASLGQTVSSVLGGTAGPAAGAGATTPEARLEGAGQTLMPPQLNPSQAAPRAASQAPGGAGNTASTTLANGTRLVVDADRNALVIVGSAQDYERIRPLLTKLDVPPLEVLIEVTVAELTLNDSDNLGIEWSLGHNIGDGLTQSLGTSATVTTAAGTVGGAGLSLGTGGFNYTLLNGLGQVRFVLNALSQNNHISVLSTPRILAKSGAQASIEVGTQVPIVTSQGTSSALQIGGSSGILQSIEYQKTGVLLTVSPVVHSGNRVDLSVVQDVSAAIPNATSSISSPEIEDRNVKTQLTLGDGQTVVIGGMIQDTRNDNDQGVPYLKDIPVLGLLFRNQAVSRAKTELLIFITPYVVATDNDASAITRQFRDQMQKWPLPSASLEW